MPVGKSFKIDFTNVSEGSQFNSLLLEPGQYAARITDVNEATSKAGNKQVVFTIKVDGHSGTYPYYCAVEVGDGDRDQFWKIRGMFQHTGTEVPKAIRSVNPDKLIGRKIGVELADDEYNGKVKSSIVNVFPVADVGKDTELEQDDDYDEDEVEEAPVRKKRAPAKRAPAPVEDDEDEDEDDYEEEPEPAPKRRAPAKKAAPRKRRPEPEPEEDEDYEDDDELEEEPAPKRRAPAKRAPAKKAAPTRRRRAAAVEEDEDDDLDDIDVDEV